MKIHLIQNGYESFGREHPVPEHLAGVPSDLPEDRLDDMMCPDENVNRWRNQLRFFCATFILS
jgi:hypothetical protein